MKRIIVTGGAGFIGANFIHTLFADPQFDGIIVNLDSLTYAGNLQSLEDVQARWPQRYFFEHTNIRDNARVAEIIAKYKPDTIINFAAESHVDRSIDGPMEFIDTNIVGTEVLLDNCKL